MPDIAEDPPSFGWIFERLEQVKNTAHEVQQESTEFYEKRLADALWDLAYSMEDLTIVVRDHLSCHDCPEGGEDESATAGGGASTDA